MSLLKQVRQTYSTILYGMLGRFFPGRNFRIVVVVVFGALVLVGTTSFVFPAHAQVLEGLASGILSAFSWIMIQLSSIFIKLTIFFLRFFILVAGYNNYIDAGVVKLGWNMVRDVANMFFVVFLLVIAFGTILGLEQYELKKMLPKLIIAALFINFSNLICQAIIDVAQVFTITFLNAIASTAGGNLIAMFNFDTIYDLAVGPESQRDPEGLPLDLFGAAALTVFFSATAMVAVGAYLIVLLIRLVVLWISIILSPLAFLLSTLPSTKSYANEFWQEFIKHVISAPIMVFFLWLAFATLGGGQESISAHLEANNPVGAQASLTATDIDGNAPSIGISGASSWDRMANFAVAVGFLLVGLERVQKLGVKGGGLVGGAVNFGKNVATIASGYAAGRYLLGGGAKLAKKGLKGAAYYAPVVGGEKWEKGAKILGRSVQGWYHGKGSESTPEAEKTREELEDLYAQKQAATGAGRERMRKEIGELEKTREGMKENEAFTSLSPEEQEKTLAKKDEEIKKKKETLNKGELLASDEQKKAQLDEQIKQKEELMPTQMGGSIIGWAARRGIALDKQLAKTEKQAENRRLVLWKRTGSEAGGNVLGGAIQIGMGTEGLKVLGTGIGKKGLSILGMQTGLLKGKGVFADQYAGKEAQDRIERGWLAAEEMRSKAKDHEFESMGEDEVLGKARLKFNTDSGKVSYEVGKGTMMERIQGHEMGAQVHAAATKRLEGEARLKLVTGQAPDPTTLAQHMKHDGFTGSAYDYYIDKQSKTKMTEDTVGAEEKGRMENKMKQAFMEASIVDIAAQDVERGKFDDEVLRLKAEIGTIEKELQGDKDFKKRAALEEELKKHQEKIKETEAKSAEAQFQHKQDPKLKKLREEKEQREKRVAQFEKDFKKAGGDLKNAEDDLKKDPENDALKKAAQEKRKKLEAEEAKLNAEKGKLQDVDDVLTPAQTTFEADQSLRKQEIEEAKTEMINGQREIDTVDDEMKSKNSDGYTKVQKRDELQKKVKDRMESVLKAKATAIRNGDMGEIDSVINWIDTNLEDAKLKKDDARGIGLAADKTHWATAKKMSPSGAMAWRYGVATGRAADISTGYRYAHNLLLSEAEQRMIHDPRGLDTPTNALPELIEEYTKSFSEMSIDSFVNNAGPMLVRMMEKTTKGEITEQDKAALMGLFKRGFDRAWLDDAIYAITGNKEAKAQISDKLGWKDNHYTDDKIRDVQMLFATGANVDFVRNNAVFTEIMDAARTEFKMEADAIIQGFRTGVFADKNGKNVASELKGKVRELLKKRGKVSFGDKDTGGFGTEDQEDLFTEVFSEKEAARRTTKFGKKGAARTTQEWVDVITANQAALQMVGNLRPEAIRTGHYENAGWANSRDIGGGNNLYIPMGLREARAHVMGDVRKGSVRDRLASQTHSWADIDEMNAQVMTALREDDFRSIFNGADPRTFNSINVRAKLHLLGLSATDDVGKFRDEEGSLVLSQMVDASGQLTNAAKTWTKVLKDDVEFGKTFAEAKTAQEQEAVMAQAQMQRLFAREMRGNMDTFLMTFAEGAGVNQIKAIQEGTMDVKIYNPVLKKMKRYINVNELIDHYNAGHWEIGSTAEKSVAPEQRISNFRPPIVKEKKEGEKEDQQQNLQEFYEDD